MQVFFAMQHILFLWGYTMRRRTGWFLWLLSFLLSGCATLPDDDAPFVTLSHIEPQALTLLEQRYRIQLRIQNPTAVPLSIAGMSFNLDMNDRRFARGVTNQAVTVPAFGQVLVETQITSTVFQVFEQMRRWGSDDGEAFRYRLSGKLFSKENGLSIPFVSSDEIRL